MVQVSLVHAVHIYIYTVYIYYKIKYQITFPLYKTHNVFEHIRHIWLIAQHVFIWRMSWKMGSGALAPHMGHQTVEWNWHVLVEGNQSRSLRLFSRAGNISKHAGPYFTAKWVSRGATQSGDVITRLRKEDTSEGASHFQKDRKICVDVAIIEVTWAPLEK